MRIYLLLLKSKLTGNNLEMLSTLERAFFQISPKWLLATNGYMKNSKNKFKVNFNSQDSYSYKNSYFRGKNSKSTNKMSK